MDFWKGDTPVVLLTLTSVLATKSLPGLLQAGGPHLPLALCV